MLKTINIDGKNVTFKATAATIRNYRLMFGRDLLLDFQKLTSDATDETFSTESLTIFENLAYTMAKQADPSIPDTADEWLDEFDMLSIYVVLPEIVELWRLSANPVSTPKKKA